MKQLHIIGTLINQNRVHIVNAVLAGVIAGLLFILLSGDLITDRIDTADTVISNSATKLELIATKTVQAKDFSNEIIKGKNNTIATVRVTNNSDRSQAFIPSNQFMIKTGDGVVYFMQPISGLEDSIPSGAIEPGRSVEGNIGFITDSEMQNPWLFFDHRWDGRLPIILQLND